MLRLLILALALTGSASAKPGGGEADRLLALGDSLARAGDHDGAEAAYATAESWGWTSAALAHNRGLAALRAGRVGAAVGHLLRARRLSPADRSILQSLAAARSAAGVTASTEGEGWALARAAARPAGVGGLIALAAIAGLGAVVAARRRRALALTLAGAAGVAWMVAASAWYDAAPRGTAVATTIVRQAPAAAAHARATLRPGRSARLGSVQGAWVRVHVPGGASGWAPAQHVAGD